MAHAASSPTPAAMASFGRDQPRSMSNAYENALRRYATPMPMAWSGVGTSASFLQNPSSMISPSRSWVLRM
eukprot:1376616-Rhodomonas_salina.1